MIIKNTVEKLIDRLVYSLIFVTEGSIVRTISRMENACLLYRGSLENRVFADCRYFLPFTDNVRVPRWQYIHGPIGGP